jgi:hypothetical protein
VQHQPCRETHVASIQREGGEQVDALLHVKVIDRFGRLSRDLTIQVMRSRSKTWNRGSKYGNRCGKGS